MILITIKFNTVHDTLTKLSWVHKKTTSKTHPAVVSHRLVNGVDLEVGAEC